MYCCCCSTPGDVDYCFPIVPVMWDHYNNDNKRGVKHWQARTNTFRITDERRNIHPLTNKIAE